MSRERRKERFQRRDPSLDLHTLTVRRSSEHREGPWSFTVPGPALCPASYVYLPASLPRGRPQTMAERARRGEGPP